MRTTIILFLAAVLVVIAAKSGNTQAPPGTDIYLAPISLDRGSVTVGSPVNITSRPGYDNQPFFSFDGSYLLYTAADTSGATDIYRYDIRSTETSRVTDTPESEYSPTIIRGTGDFSTVRVESGGAQRLWRFDLDGGNPRLVLTAVDSVGYHTWLDENTLGLFVLGEPHTLRIADVASDTDRIVATDIGRCIATVPGEREITFVQIAGGDPSWITKLDQDTGKTVRLAETLPGRQDYAWTPTGDLLMADGEALFVWMEDKGWTAAGADAPLALTNITRLAVSANGGWIALVADDS
jgi:hypothetical protein